MDPTLFFAQASFVGDMRQEKLNGRDFLVRPLKIIKPMVLHGLHAEGRGELLPAEELRRCPIEAWNAVPFTLGHPYVLNGEGGRVFQSIGSPAMHQQFYGGKIFQSHFDNEGRVSAEAWLDVDACQLAGEHGQRAIALFQSNDSASVSSAYHFTPDLTPGEFGGQAYNAVQRNIHPDHVALLLDSAGACDLKDGCGLGVNCTTCKTPATNSESEDTVVDRVLDGLRKMLGLHESKPRETPSVVPTLTPQEKEESVDPIKTLEQFYACTEIDDSVKTTVRESLAFMEAEQDKQRIALEERLAALANNEQVTLTLEELRTLPETAIEKLETMASALNDKPQTNFGPRGIPKSALASQQRGENEFVPTKSTIPHAKGA